MSSKPSKTQAELLELVKQGKDAWNEWAGAHRGAAVDFVGVVFDGNVSFVGFNFPGDASFSKATFNGNAEFHKATFNGDAVFREATFDGDAVFREATFSGNAVFSEATFNRYAWFDSANVEIIANSGSAVFLQIPSFQSVRNAELIVLDEINFKLPKPDSLFGKCVFFVSGLFGVQSWVEANIRTLRGIADKTYAIDVERDLSTLERNAQAGAAWASIWAEKNTISKRIRSLFTAITMTPLLLAYRWSSNYGRSVLLPLLF